MTLSRQCTPDDCMQLTLLALAETVVNILRERAVPKSRRDNRLKALADQIEQVNNTFEGYLPDNWIQHSMKFNQTVEAAIVTLLKTYKLEKGSK